MLPYIPLARKKMSCFHLFPCYGRPAENETINACRNKQEALVPKHYKACRTEQGRREIQRDVQHSIETVQASQNFVF